MSLSVVFFISENCYITPWNQELHSGLINQKLTKIQFRLLIYLLIHIGYVVSTDELMLVAWDTAEDVSKAELYVYMNQIRKLLKSYANIVTIRGKGYMLMHD